MDEKELLKVSFELEKACNRLKHLIAEGKGDFKYNLFIEKYKHNKKNNISELANECGVSRVTIYKWISNYDKKTSFKQM